MNRLQRQLAQSAVITSLAVFAWAGAAATPAAAQIVLTTGPGSAVPIGTEDFIATFDTVVTGTDLSAYSEGGLNVTVPGTAFENFDPTAGNGGFSPPFHYPSGGVTAFTVITPTGGQDLSALEVSIGNGFSNQTTFLAYRVLNNGTVLTSGAVAFISGQVFGILGTGGTVFDEVRLGAYQSLAEAQATTETNPQLNALALDTARANIAGAANVAAPEPATLALLAAGLLPVAGAVARRRRNVKG